MKLALGVNSFDEFADRIRVFLDLKSPQGFLDKLKMLPLLTEAGKFFPKTVSTGPCKKSSSTATSPSSTSPSCNAGRKTPAASSLSLA